MFKQPLAEVFGFPVDNDSPEAERCRRNRLCPYNNNVPNCNKDSVTNPLGICSIFHRGELSITCPVRLRQDWMITEQAAAFFFAPEATWTTLLEVRLKDKHGRSAGNIDAVLVCYDDKERVIDFGALEIQTVYISGRSVRRGYFEPLMQDRQAYLNTWEQNRKKPPRPDYLSSSRKRLAPQLIYKGGILKAWGKKQAVAVCSAFYNTLPTLTEVPQAQADLAWFIYALIHDQEKNRYDLALTRTAYTEFKPALDRITLSEPGSMPSFLATLQAKLATKLEGATNEDLADEVAAVVDEPDLEDELENL